MILSNNTSFDFFSFCYSDEESEDEEDMGTLKSGTNRLKMEKKSSNTKKVTTKRYVGVQAAVFGIAGETFIF